MLLKQELLGKIKDYFDLNLYETKVWLSLITRGIASAGQISQLSGVPRSRTYDILESLEKKGFVIIKLGKPVKYIGVRPNSIIEKLKNNALKNAEEKINILSNLKNTEEFSRLEEIYNSGKKPIKKEESSLAIKGKSNIAGYLGDSIGNAKKEVIICASVNDVYSKLKLFSNMINEIKEKKINFKIALFGDKTEIKNLSEKLKIKISKIEIDTKFFIIDQKEILFYISKESKEKGDTAIWINSEFFVKAFCSLFEGAIK